MLTIQLSISGSTENELQLPDVNTLSNGSLEIKMSGTIKLRISSTRGSTVYK